MENERGTEISLNVKFFGFSFSFIENKPFSRVIPGNFTKILANITYNSLMLLIQKLNKHQ